MSLNFQMGYTGIFNLGLYLPIIAGAMIVAYVPNRLAMQIYNITGLDFIENNAIVITQLREHLQRDPTTSMFLLLITLLLVIIVSAIIGYVVAHPALRLPANYLALFTLCIAETGRVISTQTYWIAGGPVGIAIIVPFWWLPNPYYGTAIFTILVSILIFLIYIKLSNSPFGRVLKAIRENQDTAESIGHNVSLIKKEVMVISSIFLGIGGALHAFDMGAVIADGYNRVDFSFWPWLMLIVGGAGNNVGVLLGTFILVLMRRIMITSKHYFASFLPFDVIWLEPVLLSIMLALTLIYRSEGILPEKVTKKKKNRVDYTLIDF
jgi:branched-chain amino acid transport system permease protein